MNEITKRTPVGARMTIYARGPNRIYHADYHYGGEHCRKSLKTKIKKIAMRRAAKLEQMLENGTFSKTETPPPREKESIAILDVVSEFLAYSQTEGRRRRTVVKQRGILNRFVAFAKTNGFDQLAQVDLRLIDSYRAARRKELGEKSMVHEGQLLKQFFAWCAERQLMESNPLASRKFHPPKYKPREGPSLQQINAILKTASPIRSRVLATLAFTGARSGDVAHLCVEDIDLAGNWIHFESREGFETKTGESRKVPIHARLRPILERALTRNKTGWLFTAEPSRKYPRGDHHISTKRLNEDLLQVLKKLRIPAGQDGGFTVHSLRRSFKTICVNAGIPREVVDAWQGHAHVRTPGDLYYTLPDADNQRFMKLVPFNDTE